MKQKQTRLHSIITLFLITVLLTLTLSGCGNYKLLDTTYTYNYAQFSLPDGSIIEGKVESWTDYDGEQIQITMEDGNTYLVSSFNLILSVNEIE